MTATIVIQPMALDGAVTVEAYVEAHDNRGEALQSLVSQWRPPDQWPGFAAFDAAETDGLPTRGYFGAVFDGRYVYFVPEMHGELGYPTHANVLRYDTHGDFRDRTSYEGYDAANTDGLDTRGFYGGAFDGRYIYFIPRQIAQQSYHSRLLRFDTQGGFKDPGSWSAFDIGEAHSQQSAAFDGRYLYFCPGFWGSPSNEKEYCGRVIRFDTQADFKSRSSYTSIDLLQVVGEKCACFDGGAFDGRYIYFVPLYDGVVVRFDTQKDFHDGASWQRYDAQPHGFELAVGAVFDGNYLYFCAYGYAKIIRFDTRRDFVDPGSWQTFDADHTDGLRTTGFDGGFFDGRFVYFQPFFVRVGEGRFGYQFHSHYLRYDPCKPFDDPKSWQGFDASKTDGLHSVGYNAGAFDGRYFYAAPWQQGRKPGSEKEFITHSIVLRTDTLGEHGSFSLRWCDYGHNGGLNAAMCGPSFLVNTDHGCMFVALNRMLPAGRHHLAGVYDGRTIKLYVDGRLAAERKASGRIVHCAEPVEVGRITDGQGAFRGEVLRAYVSPYAKTHADILGVAESYAQSDARESELHIELDTYQVLDKRSKLTGVVKSPTGCRWVQLNAISLDSGESVWRTKLQGEGEHAIALPAKKLAGYHRLEGITDGHVRAEVVFAGRQMAAGGTPGSTHYVEFVRQSVNTILQHHTRRLGGDGTPFVVVPQVSWLGYRSLGHKVDGKYMTYWFPEQPIEHDAFRADHELWPVLDQLSELSGDGMYRDLVSGMLDVFAERGFDSHSGMTYLSEEADFDVRTGQGCSRDGRASPRFKSRNTGNRPELDMDRLWAAMPRQMQRNARSIYQGLITDWADFSFNRFCVYGWSDADGVPALTKNSGHCAFDSAGARMIHWWAGAWRHAGDGLCLNWAQRMTDKWAAVQHAESGLIPNFFGAIAGNPGGGQPAGEWAEARSTAQTAAAWMQAAVSLRGRPGAEALAEQLSVMAVRCARGVAKYSYDSRRGVFREHLQLNGRPWKGAARYCFASAKEKAAAVKEDPQMAQVRVYAGAGWFTPGNYYEHSAGSNIPFELSIVAEHSRDAELVSVLDGWLVAAAEEAAKIDGPFTREGRWTFRATGWYVKAAVRLFRATGDRKHLDTARRLADREIAALARVQSPQWWRCRERSIFMDGLMELAGAMG